MMTTIRIARYVTATVATQIGSPIVCAPARAQECLDEWMRDHSDWQLHSIYRPVPNSWFVTVCPVDA